MTKPKPLGSGFVYREKAEAHAGLRDSYPFACSTENIGKSGFRVEVASVAINREIPMARNERTSKSVASTAAKLLSNPKTPAAVKKVAASALTQAPNKKK
jgi:hypothetical protein